MKREIERSRKLPAFTIGLEELEVLWVRAVSMFDDEERIHASIDISLASEKLVFTSVDDLRNYGELKGQVTKFSLWFSQGNQRLFIRSSNLLNSPPSVTAMGDTALWCAGAVDTVYTFFNSHRSWYHWFVSAPIGYLFIILLIGMGIVAQYAPLLPKGITIPKSAVIAVVASILSLAACRT